MGNSDEYEIGFKLVSMPGWSVQYVDGGSDKFYWGRGRFLSVGVGSDNLLHLLSKLYSISIYSEAKFQSAAIVDLASNREDIMIKPIKCKC